MKFKELISEAKLETGLANEKMPGNLKKKLIGIINDHMKKTDMAITGIAIENIKIKKGKVLFADVKMEMQPDSDFTE